jgi:hypothetical protein
VTVLEELDARAVMPPGRGRWRLTLHDRTFATFGQPAPTWQQTIMLELDEARGRRLEQSWDAAAQLTFTLDGHSPAAALIQELQHDVLAWRWSDAAGRDVCMFRGPITQSEDQVTADSHVVTFTAHDYLAMLERRMFTSNAPTPYNVDQDTLVGQLVQLASQQVTTGGTDLRPGSYLPLIAAPVTPAGAARGLSGQIRQRTYYGDSTVFEAVDLLAKVQSGFDYDVLPAPEAAALGTPAGTDVLRLFYPAQGVIRSDMALVYGTNVAGLTRSITSADYANYVRELGNSQSSAADALQVTRDAWDPEATSSAPLVGLFMVGNNLADVTDTNTLVQHAAGDLALWATLLPAYTLVLTPGTYQYGQPNMGDTVQLVVQSGRLNVNTGVRVLGINFGIGDDGDEQVELTVGKVLATLRSAFRRVNRDISALTRR